MGGEGVLFCVCVMVRAIDRCWTEKNASGIFIEYAMEGLGDFVNTGLLLHVIDKKHLTMGWGKGEKRGRGCESISLTILKPHDL